MQILGNLEEIDFYADANDPTVTYAEVVVPAIGASDTPYKLFVDVKDARLKSYIRQFVIPNIGAKVAPEVLLQEVLDVLALGGNSDMVAPRVRTAGKLLEGFMEYDLNTPNREYVRITADRWKLTRKSKHKFLKRNTLGVQVIPQETERDLISLLRPYVNTDEDSLILFATWLVQAFCMGNHSALLIMADAGSGKSTVTKMARAVIDPSKLQATIMPDKKDDLFSSLSNSYFVAFDNTEELSKEISDILCAAITGAIMAKRKLYTTNELGMYELHNTIILNGIDIIPTQSDFASRCLLLKLQAIDELSRKTDEELMSNFKKELPEILGAIFELLSKAMAIILTLNPTRLPRMASSYKEMLAIAIALGSTEEEFERIYFANIAELNKARSNIAIVEAVREYMQSSFVPGRFVEDKVSILYTKICANYSGSKKDLPKSASHFSRKLRQELKTFDAVGLTINLDDTPADGTRLKIIKNK